jgi:putative pre-16S rRNA nuclease
MRATDGLCTRTLYHTAPDLTRASSPVWQRLTGFARGFYTPRALQRIKLSKAEENEAAPQRNAFEGQTGRLLALDLGHRRVGLAVSDELRVTVRPLRALPRTNWKQLLRDVSAVLLSFDAQALVLGLPLNMDGTEGPAALEARRLARNFELSLSVPVYLQDERLTSREAENSLRAAGIEADEMRALVDSESAAIILRDFIASLGNANA